MLPDRVANQIAAGEVIERPASIVKELVENSLDAGATRIEVEYASGGRSLIRVEDNGRGMSRDDALLSIERHATSKIREATDLDRVISFGFRGEALPSIASVSHFVLRSRAEGEESGTEIVIDGGKLLHVRDCGMPVGTRIVITRLFNTVPARRKFLKSDRTEAGHIVQSARLYALASPGVAFNLIEDRRPVFQSPVCPDLLERVTEIFGRQIAELVVPVAGAEGDLRIEGLLGRPGVGRGTRHEMITFVNGRPVESRTLAYAILESYHTLIPKGRYPVAFLFLSIDPAGVDVNVHPSKREIRFRDEPRVRGFTIRTVLDGLRSSETRGTPGAVEHSPDRADISRSRPTERAEDVSGQSAAPGSATPVRSGALPGPSRVIARPRPPEPPVGRTEPVAVPPRPSIQPVDWVLIGSLQATYLLFETGAGLVLLDHRAAEQRIWFERLMREFREGEAAGQRLLFPIPVEFDPIGGTIVVDHLEFFGSHGFEVAPFGRNTFRLESVPVWLKPERAEDFLRDLVGLIRQGSLSSRKPDLAAEALARMACRRLTDSLKIPGAEEAAGLIRALFACSVPQSDPSGRPTYIELDSGELNRRFHKGRATSTDALF
ncbi:MAG: DNA mismatch repair endonuclease MutL [Opitutaceae bacterium]